MPRLLFEKKGNAVWISHLDLMRLFQRAFKRSALPLKHTQGFNPRPSVSIALPLSVGVESSCELLDFDLDCDHISCEDICSRLNETLVDGVKVLAVYDNGTKIKHLSFLQCCVDLEYDAQIPQNIADAIRELFSRQEVLVEKKSKNGISEQNIIPMIRSLEVLPMDEHWIRIQAKICCQNPTLNPAQIGAAIEKYLPDMKPDFIRCSRVEIFDTNDSLFR